MLELLLLFSMIFFHIWDDYGRQGILANMKQESWWKKQEGYSNKYENDWAVALVTHAFSWTFMIYIPIIAYILFNRSFFSYEECMTLLFTFLLNWGIHTIVDHLKCNELILNLWQDQLIHLVQIFTTFFAVIAFQGINP